MSKKIIIRPPVALQLKDANGMYIKPTEADSTITNPLLNLGASFPKQFAFTNDTSKFIAAQCSRRAGKTNGLAIRFFKTLEKHPKSQCVYLSLTLDSAREIMWPVLQELNDKYNLKCTFVDSKLIMTHPNGAYLRLYGADMKNFIKRLKGRKFPGIAIDEAQDFGSHLQSLVDDVLEPCLADYADGWLAITGTPGPVPQGYFFEVTQNRQYGYSFHEWTLLDNPYMPDPAAFIDNIKRRKQWTETHPTLLREYRNKWVLDPHSLWVNYNEPKNHYQNLPIGKKVNYILGIDIGFKDADALALLSWYDDSPVTYLVEEIITAKQGLTELVQQIKDMEKRYPISKMVIDEGGLGKKLAEEMRRRHHIPVQPADKTRKQESVEILNDALRIGNFKAKSNSRFAKDSYLVQIDWDKSTPGKIVVKKQPHSDIIDAVIYAFKESPAFTYEPPPPEPKYGSEEWAKQQTDEMFNNAVEHFQKLAKAQRGESSDDF